MNTIFVFDTETNGLPNWKMPSDDPSQPHMVQVAGLIVDADTTDIIQTLDVIIKPDGWIITPELTEIHGITTEHAMDVGISEHVAMDMVMAMAEGRKRVAFNTTFDNRIIRIGLKRFFSEATADAWKAGDYECAMLGARKVMGGKNPKLVDAYRHFTGLELENAHTAMADTLAAMEVYFAIHANDPAPAVVSAAEKAGEVIQNQPIQGDAGSTQQDSEPQPDIIL